MCLRAHIRPGEIVAVLQMGRRTLRNRPISGDPQPHKWWPVSTCLGPFLPICEYVCMCVCPCVDMSHALFPLSFSVSLALALHHARFFAHRHNRSDQQTAITIASIASIRSAGRNLRAICNRRHTRAGIHEHDRECGHASSMHNSWTVFGLRARTHGINE